LFVIFCSIPVLPSSRCSAFVCVPKPPLRVPFRRSCRHAQRQLSAASGAHHSTERDDGTHTEKQHTAHTHTPSHQPSPFAPPPPRLSSCLFSSARLWPWQWRPAHAVPPASLRPPSPLSPTDGGQALCVSPLRTTAGTARRGTHGRADGTGTGRHRPTGPVVARARRFRGPLSVPARRVPPCHCASPCAAVVDSAVEEGTVPLALCSPAPMQLTQTTRGWEETQEGTPHALGCRGTVGSAQSRLYAGWCGRHSFIHCMLIDFTCVAVCLPHSTRSHCSDACCDDRAPCAGAIGPPAHALGPTCSPCFALPIRSRRHVRPAAATVAAVPRVSVSCVRCWCTYISHARG
jgi:hypothetical protein